MTGKYIVLKIEDLDKYIGKGMDRSIFDSICNRINHLREKDGKTRNEYVVLNLDDKIDLHYLGMHCHYAPIKYGAQVRDISTAIVNAILEAKKDATKTSPENDIIMDAQNHPRPE